MPVKIQLTTNISVDDEVEKYELFLFGYRYQKGNVLYLKYDEVQEEGTVHSVVKITADEVMIMRSGLVKMRLTFRLNEAKGGSHESDLGTLIMETMTTTLIHQENETQNSGSLQLKYDLSMQGTQVGKYEMKIKYEEENHAE